MQNMSYQISEKPRPREQINIDELMAEVAYTSDHNIDEFSCDAAYATRVDYMTNYNVKQLQMFLEYYKIPKRNMKKDAIVCAIVSYESEVSNFANVERRKRLWKNVAELKQDEFFAKYLIIDL
tara:strand:- start:112 stop:480 length:369 start_codon:yes stop_codon:yes gene_type:complete